MTITEMRQKKSELKTKMLQLRDLAKTETRELSDEENVLIEELVTKIEEINELIQEKEDELIQKEEEIQENNKRNKPTKTMNKQFNLIRAINAVIDRRSFDQTDESVINAGMLSNRNAGVSYSGKIVLPVEERGVQVASTLGIEAVGVDVLNVLDPLRNNLVLGKLGATIMTGLQGNIQVPTYSGTSAQWAGETGCVTDTAGTWSQQTYAPLRVTAVIPVSKQWLIQESASAEAMLRRDIVKALSEKIESTLLGNAAGSATQPAGIGNLITPTTIATWSDITALEQALQTANYNSFKYGLTPQVNGIFLSTPKEGNIPIYIREASGINGNAVEVSNNIFATGGVLGDWEQYLMLIWGGVDLVIDEVSLANCGQIRIIASMYVNGGPRDLNAFKTFTV